MNYRIEITELQACQYLSSMNMLFYFFKSMSLLKSSLILAHSWIHCVYQF